MHPRIAVPLLMAIVTLAGCLRTYVPAPPGTPLDAVCEPYPSATPADWSAWALDGMQFRTPRAFGLQAREGYTLTLGRMDAELHVWSGGRWVFPAVPARQSIRCDLARGDTIVHIHAVRLDGLASFRVDVAWEPPINDRWQYMQLQTRYVAHLRELRGIIESVRFPEQRAPSGSISRPR